MCPAKGFSNGAIDLEKANKFTTTDKRKSLYSLVYSFVISDSNSAKIRHNHKVESGPAVRISMIKSLNEISQIILVLILTYIN